MVGSVTQVKSATVGSGQRSDSSSKSTNDRGTEKVSTARAGLSAFQGISGSPPENENSSSMAPIAHAAIASRASKLGINNSSQRMKTPLEKTDLLRAHSYQSGSMVLPSDYEIVSHLSTDGQQFKISGKRMDGDSLRFHARNVSTGKTLCTLKCVSTEVGFVWMHPEDTRLRGGMETSSSTEIKPAVVARLERDIQRVGTKKLLGYFEVSALPAAGYSPETLQREQEKRGMKVMFLNNNGGQNGDYCIFVYDPIRLQNYLNLTEKKEVLNKHGWPTDAKLFVQRIATEYASDAELNELIAIAFNDQLHLRYDGKLDMQALGSA